MLTWPPRNSHPDYVVEYKLQHNLNTSVAKGIKSLENYSNNLFFKVCINNLFFYWDLNLFLCCRAEPLLTQIKGDRKLIVSPVFDRVNYYDLEIVTYLPASHAFDWALWCMYERFRPEWYKLNDPTLPGK